MKGPPGEDAAAAPAVLPVVVPDVVEVVPVEPAPPVAEADGVPVEADRDADAEAGADAGADADAAARARARASARARAARSLARFWARALRASAEDLPFDEDASASAAEEDCDEVGLDHPSAAPDRVGMARSMVTADAAATMASGQRGRRGRGGAAWRRGEN